MMMLFADLKNNIPLVDFAAVIDKALRIFTTMPKCVWRELHRLDGMIENGVVKEGFNFDEFTPFLDLSPNEFLVIRSRDVHHLLVVDVVMLALVHRSVSTC